MNFILRKGIYFFKVLKQGFYFQLSDLIQKIILPVEIRWINPVQISNNELTHSRPG